MKNLTVILFPHLWNKSGCSLCLAQRWHQSRHSGNSRPIPSIWKTRCFLRWYVPVVWNLCAVNALVLPGVATQVCPLPLCRKLLQMVKSQLPPNNSFLLQAKQIQTLKAWYLVVICSLHNNQLILKILVSLILAITIW